MNTWLTIPSVPSYEINHQHEVRNVHTQKLLKPWKGIVKLYSRSVESLLREALGRDNKKTSPKESGYILPEDGDKIDRILNSIPEDFPVEDMSFKERTEYAKLLMARKAQNKKLADDTHSAGYITQEQWIALYNKFSKRDYPGNTQDDPFSHSQVRPLTGQLKGDYRLRVGNFRILFTPDKDQNILFVYAILPRGRAY